MPDNTTKVEGLDFTVADHSSQPTEKMTRAFEAFQGAVSATQSKLSSLGHYTAMTALGAVGLGIGFRELAGKAMEANRELEDATKRIAGMQYAFGGWAKGTSAQERWARSMEVGTEVVERLKSSEDKLKIGRGELADIYRSTEALSERYGLSQEKHLDLTEKLGAAQKVLGTSAESASMILARSAFTGHVRLSGDFSKALAYSVGNQKEFAKLSEAKRFEKLQKAMGDMVPAAQGMGKSIEGSMFDIRKSVGELTRDLSGPLFKEITQSVRDWAGEMTRVQASGRSIAHEYGEKLVTAFGYLKSATGFIKDNWMVIAGLFGASKFAGMAGSVAAWGGKTGAAAAVAGAAGGAVGTMQVKAGVVNVDSAGAVAAMQPAGEAMATRSTLSQTIGKFAGLASKALVVTEVLGALYIGARGAAKMLDDWHDHEIARDAAYGTDSPLAGTYGTKAARQMEAFRGLQAGGGFRTEYWDVEAKARETFTAYQAAYGRMITRKGVDSHEAYEAYGAMAQSTRAKQLSALGLSTGATAEQFVGKLDEMVKVLAKFLPTEQRPDISGKGNIHQTIQHVELHPDFKDPNPDRVWHKLTREVVDIAHNPRGSMIPAIGGP